MWNKLVILLDSIITQSMEGIMLPIKLLRGVQYAKMRNL